jgi:hypothetical protein
MWESSVNVSLIKLNGVSGDVIFHDGTGWVRLAKPSFTAFLRNTSAGSVSWQPALTSLPTDLIYGGGVQDQVAIFEDAQIIGSKSIKTLLDELFGANNPPAFLFSDSTGVKAGGLQEADPDAVKKSGEPDDFAIPYFEGGNVIKGLAQPTADSVLMMDGGTLGLRWVAGGGMPAGTVGQVLYHNGTNWVVLGKPSATSAFLRNTSTGLVTWADPLPSGMVGQMLVHNGTSWVTLQKPASDMYLKNTAAGAVSWGTPATTVQSSGGTGASLVTTDGKIKTIYGY